MYFFNFLFTIICATYTLAHGGESASKHEEPLKEHSLADLISLKNNIPSNWETTDQTKFEEGRIILTPKQNTKGSLWLKKPLQNLKAFTVEWTFRSLNYQGKQSGGLSFWFISVDQNDNKLFNGPSKYEGLQLLVDNNSPLSQSIHAQLNDGQQPFSKDTIYDHSFASCLMGYQDSSVPLTLRLTYDSTNDHLLKLQVDNRVCFQTRKIKLNDIVSKGLKLGVTADNENTLESFEILRMKFFDSVTQEALIPNVNSMPQPKMLTKVIDGKTGTEKIIEKDKLDAQNKKMSTFELYKKMDRLEGKILANDISDIEKKINDLLVAQQNLVSKINLLANALQNGKGSVSSGNNKNDNKDDEQFKDFLSMNEKLEKMLTEQSKIREATRVAHENRETGPQIDEIVSKLTVWLVPLMVIMCIMAYYTFKIRQEIVKTKLL